MSQLNNNQSNDKENKKGFLKIIKGWFSKIPSEKEMREKWEKETSHQDSTYASGFGIAAPIDENWKPSDEEEKRDKEIALGAALVTLSPLLMEALGVVLASEGIALGAEATVSIAGKVLEKVSELGLKAKKTFIQHPIANSINAVSAFGGTLAIKDHFDNSTDKKLDTLLELLKDKKECPPNTNLETKKELDEIKKQMEEQDAKLDALLKVMQLEKNEEGEYHLQKHDIKGFSHLSDEDKAEANRRNNIPTRMEIADLFEKLDGKMTGRLALIQMKLDQSWGGAINENWLEKLYDAFRDDDRFEWFFQEFFYQEWTRITMHFNYDNDDELI